MPDRAERKWRVEFPWQSLSAEQKARLLVAIGDCDGEWWGGGHAEFHTATDAARAIDFASRLRLVALS